MRVSRCSTGVVATVVTYVLGVALGLLGHYYSERFAMEWLAQRLADLHPELSVWASRDERDPLELLPPG